MKKTIVTVLIAAVIGFVASVFLGDWLAAQISTWHWVQKYGLLSPRAPLVIHTREEVRVNDTNDIINIINRSKSRVGALLDTSGGQVRLAGSVTTATADGVFFATRSAVGNTAANSFI